VAAAGYIDRAAEKVPMTADGLRLINAIKGAGDEITLPDLKRLVAEMDGADRLSLTFRFQDGSTQLDDPSRENLTDLARLLEAGQFDDSSLVLAGFSDGSGAAAANMDLSLARATGVLDALRAAAPELPEAALPRVVAFGETMPMACDTTAPGRRINRRVEVWLRPRIAAAATDSPVP
jgi:phosphate transport system substrate-binding protein